MSVAGPSSRFPVRRAASLAPKVKEIARRAARAPVR
jgi:DNA-binding IclR family transcriptional regulator